MRSKVDCRFIHTLGDVPNTSRMFCPSIGIPEDPVSGTAHGMLGTYLIAHNIVEVKKNEFTFRGYQGKSVRRPGHVDVQVTATGNVAQSVRITGDAVIIFQAELPL